MSSRLTKRCFRGELIRSFGFRLWPTRFDFLALFLSEWEPFAVGNNVLASHEILRHTYRHIAWCEFMAQLLFRFRKREIYIFIISKVHAIHACGWIPAARVGTRRALGLTISINIFCVGLSLKPSKKYHSPGRSRHCLPAPSPKICKCA